MTRKTVLVVDDDPDLLKLLALRLGAAGYAVHAAESGEKALAVLAVSRPDVVVTDLKMGGMDGLALFEAIQKTAPALPVIILTAHGTIPDAVDATRRGVFGFLPKPFEGKDLLAQVEQALKLSSTGAAPGEAEDRRAELVTASPQMESLLAQAKLVAQSDASVLIHGASGTGKELLARSIHKASRRRAAPFVAVNCAAIPEALLESELFGHRKGAFTGAIYDHKGLFQSAEGGTVFLDEIGDMPMALQAKLLRVLQEREVEPLGSNAVSRVDGRVIAASSVDLATLVADGRFRSDLYYRLNVLPIRLPPLRERPEDLEALCEHLLEQLALEHEMLPKEIDRDALEALAAMPWPGNVRELRNVLERACSLWDGMRLTLEAFREVVPEIDAVAVRAETTEVPAEAAQPGDVASIVVPDATASTLPERVAAVERAAIREALRATGGNRVQAARRLGIARATLYQKLAEFPELRGPP